MLDLSNAINCIKIMKEYGTYRGEKIGRIVRAVSGLVIKYRRGEMVLYTEEFSSETNGQKRNLGTLTIETPLIKEEIDKEKAKGSLLTTIRTMVGVPKNFVRTVRIPKYFVEEVRF